MTTPQNVTGRVLTAEKMTDHNTFENPNVVRPAPFGGVKVDGDLISHLPVKKNHMLDYRLLLRYDYLVRIS